MAAVREGGVDEQAGAALLLAGLPRVGAGDACRLIERTGGPLAALAAAPDAAELSPRGRAAADRLRGRPAAAARAEAERAARDLRPGDRLLFYGGPGYPDRLRRLDAPPPVLWARGPLPAETPRAVAVVGTRAATSYGRQQARELASGLAERGVRVVSGLASGIDGAAHRGALAVKGETAAVLGSGLGFQYPLENHDIYARLHEEGLVLTEFAPATRPAPYNFPRRNRIVAALSDAVVVVQAGVKSGALITVDRALEIGVDVFAYPGDVRLPASAGCHGLLRDGAAIVTCAGDVLRLLDWEDPSRSPAAPRAEEAGAGGPGAAGLLERLGHGPAALDELTAIAGGPGPASLQLARLEFAGAIEALPGGRFRQVERAERERRIRHPD